MSYIFLAALGFVLLLLLLQKLETAETRLIISTVKWTLVGVMTLGAVYFTLAGRLLLVAALIILLVLLLKRDFQNWRDLKKLPPSLPKPMTEQAAASLLKVDLKASVEEIEEAYKKVRPKDSVERAQLLRARDTLLKGKKNS